MQYEALLVPTVQSTVPLISLVLWPVQQSSLAIIASRYCVFTVHTHTKRINLSLHFLMPSLKLGPLRRPYINVQWFRPVLATYVTQTVPKRAMIPSIPGDLRHTNHT